MLVINWAWKGKLSKTYGLHWVVVDIMDLSYIVCELEDKKHR